MSSSSILPSPAIPLVVVVSLLIVTLLASPGGGLPTPQTNLGIAVGPGNARGPSLAVDSTGLLHLVHSDDVAGEYGVYYLRSADGITWSPSVRIDAPGTSSYFPRVAVEREPVPTRGRAHVVYQLGTGAPADIWYTSSDDGITWAPTRRIDTAPAGIVSTAPAIGASRSRAYVTWSDNRDGTTYQLYLRGSSDAGGTWGVEIPLSNAGVSNLQSRVEAKDDTVVVVWRQAASTGTSIVSARSLDAGASWAFSTVDFGMAATDNLQDPDLFLDDLGVAHVAWVYQPPTGEAHILYSWSADGLTWSAPATVDDMTGSAFARSPSIQGVAGTLWVGWADQRGGDYDIFASWSSDGRTWGDGLRNGNDLRVDDTDRNGVTIDDPTNQIAPVLRTGGFGIFAAWEDFRDTMSWDVYYSGVDVSPLVITEVQDEPSSGSRVEIYNFGGTPFSLTGVTIEARHAGGSSGFSLAPLGTIPPRTHVVVGQFAGSDLVGPLDLGTEGASVQLLRGADVLASAGSGPYGIAPDPLPGESVARYAGTLDYVAAWNRATAPSFGSRNLVAAPNLAPPIVLNEVLFDPANAGDRFVELYLRAGMALDLTGYRLVGDGVYSFSGIVVGTANPYALLLETRSPAWFGPLDAAADNVYLYDAGGRLLDMIGWTIPHAVGGTVARTTLGAGGTRAFEETTASANGWAFDQQPTLALVDLEADAAVMADIGTTVQFALRATNLQTASEYINVDVVAAGGGWSVSLEWPTGIPLTDSPGDFDAVPDLGTVEPGATANFVVEVAIPLEGAVGDGNTFTVGASAASVPVSRDSVALEVNLYPHFDVLRTVSPSAVYLEGSGPPWNEIAQITLTIEGAGFPIVEQVPQDVVFQLDVSGSMNTEDPSNLRVDAVKDYIDNMRVDDRGSIIGFSSSAWVVNNRPLTYATPIGKADLKGDADTLACSPACAGATNIDDALQIGTNWLIAGGDPSRPRIEILLTDGMCTVPGGNPCPNTQNIINQAVGAGIIIYTIGLGPRVPRAFLENIANQTGGRYYHADTPQDLQPIYEEIGTRVNRTAGVDPDPTDNVPLIEDDIAPYLTVVPGSFYDPATGGARAPSSFQSFGDRTRLQWNVPRIEINETWEVRYSVTSTRLGVQDVALHPDARVAYRRWDGSSVFQSIPQATLEVLAPPSPPQIMATNPPDGATDVPLDQPISAVFSEAMDTPTVAWTIAPAVPLTPSWSTSQILVLGHAGLSQCAEYTVEITAGRDTDGEPLVPGPVPNPWRFQTVCPQYVEYTITRLPVRGYVLVDGLPYPAPAVFIWRTGEAHEIEAPVFDVVGSSRFAFDQWDDGGNRTHVITTGTEDAKITAEYRRQHEAMITLIGLPSNRPATVRFTFNGSGSTGTSSTAWLDWVDDSSPVDIDALLAGIPGERFITLDPTAWIATGPLREVVTYSHQYTATLRMLGLETHDVSVDFVAFRATEQGLANVTWNAWVDAGSKVRAPDTLSLGTRERYRTLDATVWTADAPIDATLLYRHQYRPLVALQGLDETHTVGASWRLDGVPDSTRSLVDGLYEWADAGTVLAFDAMSTGQPTYFAQNATSLAVTSGFDATIWYAAPLPPPSENWKPVLALVYTVALLAVGGAYSRRSLDYYTPPSRRGTSQAARAAWARLPVGQKFAHLSLAEVEEKVHRDRTATRVVLLVPFAAIEGAIGLVSHLTGLFRIPDASQWLPLGFWVNTILLTAGLLAGGLVYRKGYRMTDDALLRLAVVRDRDAEAPRRDLR